MIKGYVLNWCTMERLLIIFAFLLITIGFYLVYLSVRILASRINRLFIELENIKKWLITNR